MKKIFLFLTFLTACARQQPAASDAALTETAAPAAPAELLPAPAPVPAVPKVGVEAKEEGEFLVLVSKRGDEELDRLKVRKIRGLRFEGGRECTFDNPANEVDFVIAPFVVEASNRNREEAESELYSVYGANRNDGKIQKFQKKAASCYFPLP